MESTADFQKKLGIRPDPAAAGSGSGIRRPVLYPKFYTPGPDFIYTKLTDCGNSYNNNYFIYRDFSGGPRFGVYLNPPSGLL